VATPRALGRILEDWAHMWKRVEGDAYRLCEARSKNEQRSPKRALSVEVST